MLKKIRVRLTLVVGIVRPVKSENYYSARSEVVKR